MKGQLVLEFLIAFLAMILIVQCLYSVQEKNLIEMEKALNQARIKMVLEEMATACNLRYFNDYAFPFSFNLSGYRTANNAIISEESGVNISSECFSNVSALTKMEVEGLERWFRD